MEYPHPGQAEDHRFIQRSRNLLADLPFAASALQYPAVGAQECPSRRPAQRPRRGKLEVEGSLDVQRPLQQG
jgi:hypothetical protein